jgi:hypothetical protein
MMERRFDMSDFEQSLRDHADQFNMVPSRRVWRGIYNNLYPGRKWPSITVAIAFIITLFTIGHLNNSPKGGETNQLSKPAQNENIHRNIALSNTIKSSDKTDEANETNDASTPNYSTNSSSNEKDLLKNSIGLNQSATQTINEKNNIPSKNKKGNLTSHAITADATNLFSNSNNTLTRNYAIVQNYDFSIDKVNRTDLVMNENLQKYIEGNNATFSSNEYNAALGAGNSIPSKPIFTFARFVPNELSLVDNNSLFANAIILKEEDKNSLLNKIRKKIKKAKWMYYLTPSLSSASFINKDAPGILSNFSLLQNRSSNGMMYKAGLGLEAGAQASYRFSAKWDFITGANIRYSGYNVISNLVHPTFAKLSFRDNTGLEYSKTYITHFGNGRTQNQINLLNYSVQASLPVGLQYHIWQDKNVQINLLSTVDVSAVLKSNAYIISSDGRYYVKDPSLSRPVNMGINFNPNIVLSGQKIKWHLGPSVRYQLFSRYKNNYLSKEHLIDYGIRIGISK